MREPGNTETLPPLAKLGRPELAVFNDVSARLLEKSLIARGGRIIDATFVPAPEQHNSRGEKALIEQDAMPAAKRCEKDIDAEVRADSSVLFARSLSAPALPRFLSGESLQELLRRTAERIVDAAHAVAPARSHSDRAGSGSAQRSHHR